MPTRTLTTAAKATAVALAAALTFTATAGPASANSFERRVYQGKVWYNDGYDRFCVRADETGIRDRAVIEVTLTPYNLSRGPVVKLYDIDTAGYQCKSLATAYEDTKYRARIRSTIHFDRGGDSTYEYTNIDFWS